MNTKLFLGFKDEKERIVKELKENTFLVEYIVRLLEREMKDTPFFTDFDDPNWTVKQAAQSGRYSALEDIRNLLHSTQERN